MGDAEEPRDVRDTLTELERRLLELERELRSSAAEDTATGAGSPPAPPPAGAPPPAPAPAGAAPGPADPAVEQLAADARERLAALRASLEGLEGASDRLRETAQTVVEDHGRALVRLDRAGAAGAPPPRAEPPAARPVEPPAPLTPPPPPPGDDRDRRMAWIAVALAVALLAGLLAATLLGRSNNSGAGTSATTATTAAPTAVLVTPGAPDVGLPNARLRDPATALASVCAGRAAAAVVVTPAGEQPAPVCDGAVVLTDDTLSADALAVRVRRGGGGRRCVSAGAVDALTRERTDIRATRRRQARTTAAAADARTAARLDGLEPVALIRAARGAEAAAGSAFDEAQGLRLLAVAGRPGGTCLRPGDAGYPLATRIQVVAASAAADRPATLRLQSAVLQALTGDVPLRVTVLR